MNVIEFVLIADSSFWFETFTTNNENILFVELTNTERLSWFLKVWKHDPLLATDREEFTGVQTLNEWSASNFIFSVGHSTQNINVILEFMNDVISSRVEHVVKRL